MSELEIFKEIPIGGVTKEQLVKKLIEAEFTEKKEKHGSPNYLNLLLQYLQD